MPTWPKRFADSGEKELITSVVEPMTSRLILVWRSHVGLPKVGRPQAEWMGDKQKVAGSGQNRRAED